LADQRAEQDAAILASPKPMATRCSEVRMRQPRPMSWGPVTKNGSMIRSFASAQMRVGEGSVAFGFMQRICQTTRMTISVITGGTVRAVHSFAAGTNRV
jgi:hypothetical protein